MQPLITKEIEKTPKSILILNDIRSVINVGAIFRTADAAGVGQIILSGVTPTPIDRFGRIRTDFNKASLGAEHSVPWETSDHIVKTIQNLKKQGYTIICIEQNKKSMHFKKYKAKKDEKVVLIPGNEVEGVPKTLLKLADVILELPMHGIKESLNVSVATGIVLYHVLNV